MSQVNAVVVCEGISIDALTGRITAFNILDVVYAPRLPALLPRIHVLVSSERSGDPSPSARERVSLLAEDGTVISRTDAVDVEFTRLFHSSLHSFWSVRFDTAGALSVVVEHQAPGRDDWTAVFRRTLVAQVAPHPLMPAQPASPGAGGGSVPPTGTE